jgi:ABC-2 type transport system ATP-binding protein
VRTVALAKSYGRIEALSGLDMQVERGEVFGFLGPNGAGKTTAVKLLLGLVAPSGGEGWVLGRPLGDRDARRRLGYLPELFRYQGWLSAREVLALHCELARVERSSWGPEIDRVLAIAGLADRGGDRVATFSKGMTQRLGLAVALLGRPELVVLDEPTSALDPVGRHDVREIIRGLRAEGAAVFLNSHLLSEVEQVCDRVAIVNRGRVIAAGRIGELLGGHAVRLRVAGLTPSERSQLAAFGELREDEGWLVVQGCEPERVPDLVAAIVRLGARVYAVEPRRGSLEQAFLELLT